MFFNFQNLTNVALFKTIAVNNTEHLDGFLSACKIYRNITKDQKQDDKLDILPRGCVSPRPDLDILSVIAPFTWLHFMNDRRSLSLLKQVLELQNVLYFMIMHCSGMVIKLQASLFYNVKSNTDSQFILCLIKIKRMKMALMD